MSATAAMVATVRRYVNEPDDANGYTDEQLEGIIESYPVLDERGQVPYTWDTSTTPPSQDANELWVPTYDLHAAAAQVWEEKAGTTAHLYTFTADGGQYVRSEASKQMMQMAKYHRARRKPGTHRLLAWPQPKSRSSAVGNLPEVP